MQGMMGKWIFILWRVLYIISCTESLKRLFDKMLGNFIICLLLTYEPDNLCKLINNFIIIIDSNITNR